MSYPTGFPDVGGGPKAASRTSTAPTTTPTKKQKLGTASLRHPADAEVTTTPGGA
jgi:hypothetical protein